MPRRYITWHDWSRTYLLWDTDYATNIARTGADGIGAHNVARGLLVELLQAFGGTPIALHVHEPHDPRSSRIRFTAVIRDAADRLLTVEEQYERPRTADGPAQRWSIRVNGTVPTDGIDSAPPSRPWLAWWLQYIVLPNQTAGTDFDGNRPTVETSQEPVR